MDTKPVLQNERIVLIDSLRGYALMGLFLVHMVEYYELFWYKQVESSYKDWVFLFFAGKSYAIFAFLFGVSFFILLNSYRSQNYKFTRLMSWRFYLLLFAGILHGLIYGGDILLLLALSGFMMVAAYQLPKYLFLLLSALFLLQIPGIIYAVQYIIHHADGKGQPLHWALYGRVYEVYAHGTFGQLLKVNASEGFVAKCTFMLESGRLFDIAGLTMLGYWFGMIGFFKEGTNGKRKYGFCLLAVLLLAVLLHISRPYIETLIHADRYWVTKALLNNYTDLVFTFVSIFAFVFLYQFKPAKIILSTLAPCGRMSLTLYVFQSLIFVPFFYGFGFGAYAYIGQQYSLAAGIICWIAQIFFAHFWFRKFCYGPLEWIWRSATLMRKDVRLRRTA